MSTVTAVDATAPSGKGKKKLILIVAAALLMLLVGGGVTALLLKNQAKAKAQVEADADAGEADVEAEEAVPVARSARAEAAAPPVFVPLDPFTVNLADREAERYAQVGMTLEIEDAKVAEQIKLFMPAIRNNILMAIADKTSGQLMDRDGKRRLALEVRRETSRALGYEVEPEDATPGDKFGRARKKRKDPDAGLPVKAVHFNNFIIQ